MNDRQRRVRLLALKDLACTNLPRQRRGASIASPPTSWRRLVTSCGVARTCRRGCLPRALVPPGVLTPPNSWSQPTVHRIVPHRLAWCILVLTTYTLPGVGCNALGASMVLTTSTHARRHTRSRTWRHPPLRYTSLSLSSAVRLCTFKRESDRHACPSSTRAVTNKFRLQTSLTDMAQTCPHRPSRDVKGPYHTGLWPSHTRLSQVAAVTGHRHRL